VVSVTAVHPLIDSNIQKMETKEILQLPTRELKKHIQQLATDYKERTGKQPCLSCSDEIKNMLNYLKQIYMKSQFQFKAPSVMYKVQKGSGKTISNDTMTDELAIEFLKVKPSRIDLFSKYPDNYKELIGEDIVEEIVKETSKKPCTNCKDKTIKTVKSSKQVAVKGKPPVKRGRPRKHKNHEK
jgi:hypothetical protein